MIYKEYPKIHSLWKREGWYFEQGIKHNPEYQEGRQSFIVGDYACEEFGLINKWYVEEKIDGTNVRICYDAKESKITFMGRTSRAQMPCHLLSVLQDIFTLEKMADWFPDVSNVILYGEGYGPKIQAGGYYSDSPGFCLFDVVIGHWWLKKSNVKEIAEMIGVLTPNFIGRMTQGEIIEFVKQKPASKFAQDFHVMEGIIARSDPVLLFRDGDPLMWKLKCREFKDQI